MSRFKPILCLLILGLISTSAVADEDIFKVGVEALNKEQYRLAIVCFNDVLRRDNTNAEAYYYRGLAQAGKGFWESAINNFSKAVQFNPKHAGAFVARGNAYIEMNDYEKAAQDHNQALQLDAKIALPQIRRGTTDWQMKHYRAFEDFDAAVRLYPKDPFPYLDRGDAYLEDGKCDKAIQDFSKAIQFSPDSFEAYLKRGKCYGRKGDFGKAIADFKEVLRIAPGNLEASSALTAAETSKFGQTFEDRMRYYFHRQMLNEETQKIIEQLDIFRKQVPSKSTPPKP